MGATGVVRPVRKETTDGAVVHGTQAKFTRDSGARPYIAASQPVIT